MIPLLLFAMMFVETPGPQETARYTPVAGTVTGRIVNLSGAPDAGERVAVLTVVDRNGPDGVSALASITRTDSDGRYRLESIVPGRYYIIAGPTDSPTYYPGVSVMSTATLVNIAAGATIKDVNFKMSAHSGVRVTGRLIHPADQPATLRETVRLTGSQPPVLQVAANPDGTFEFQRVRPGAYKLDVAGPLPSVMSPIEFDVPDMDLTGFDIRIPRAVPLSVKTVVEGSQVAAGRIATLSFFGSIFSTRTDLPANGSSFITLAEGDYDVSATVSVPSYEVQSVTIGTTNLATNRLKIDRTSPPEILVTLRILDPVRVGGRIEDSSGAPVVVGRLSLAASTGGTQLDADIRRDGSFEFTGVSQGNYSMDVQSSPSSSRFSLKVGKEDLENIRILVPAVRQIRVHAEVSGGGDVPPFLLRYDGSVAASRTRVVLSRSETVFESPPLTILGEYMTIHPADGSAVISLQEGEYRMGAEIEGDGPGGRSRYTLKSISSAGRDLHQTPLKVGAIGDLEINVVFETTTLTPNPPR